MKPRLLKQMRRIGLGGEGVLRTFGRQAEATAVIREAIARGIPPERIAERTVRAIREDRFYILPEDDPWLAASRSRLEDILLGRNPTLAVPGS